MDLFAKNGESWEFWYPLDTFSDSFHVDRAFRKMFASVPSAQWIVVYNPTFSWFCWARFPVSTTPEDVERILCKTVDPEEFYPISGSFIPKRTVGLCLEGNPYVQQNIPVDWKEHAPIKEATKPKGGVGTNRTLGVTKPTPMQYRSFGGSIMQNIREPIQNCDDSDAEESE